MIDYAEAIAKILEHEINIDQVECDVLQAEGLVLAQDVIAPRSLPNFDNSSMDGFAVIAEDTTEAMSENPVWLKQISSIAAGDKTLTLKEIQHTAVEIMTGAPIPKGYNAIVPVERTVRHNQDPSLVGITQPAQDSEFFRYKGADIQENSLVLRKGTQLTSEHLITLTSLGMSQLKVKKPLNVLIISTGKELAQQNAATKENQVYDCNSPYLSNCLKKQFSCKNSLYQLTDDSEVAFINLLTKQALKAPNPPQIIISTGAVSMGKYDFIPSGLRNIGAEIIFHKVRIRPGKPILFAKLPNGSFYFGLPGNPSSAAAGYQFFIESFIKHSYEMPLSEGVYAKLDGEYTNKTALTLFLKAIHYVNELGESSIKIQVGQESFRVAPFLNSNAWAIIQPNCHLNQGDVIKTQLF